MTDQHVAADQNLVIHPRYLPFSREQLAEHFAPVAGPGLVGRHLTYYLQSAERNARHMEAVHALPLPKGSKLCSALDHQVEKDERFWVVSALMAIFHSKDRVGGLTRLLSDAIGETPTGLSDLEGWADALGDPDQLRLYFEVNLPAPPAYKAWLGENHAGRTLLPWLVDRAAGNGREGATKMDAMVLSPSTGFAVVFEAKVLSDASSHTTYDAFRNQIARNIDVLLDANQRVLHPLSKRRPDRTCFVLLTPEVFREDPTTRLYGSLMKSYATSTTLLRSHLPHRSDAELAEVPSRLGWTTFEQCRRIELTACAWLG